MTTTPQRQRGAREELRRAFVARGNAFVLHYARDNFGSPIGRVTALVARNLGSGQTRLFSILKTAPPLTTIAAISTAQLNAIEHQVLGDFFAFVGQHQNHFWLHWNMRDARFGFEQLEDRFRALGGSPVVVPDFHKVDLANRMFDLFGDRYAAAPDRLRTLALKNGLNVSEFMDGEAQGAAIAAGDYEPVEASILKKVDALYVIADKAHSGNLKTDGSWWDRHGGTVNAVGHWVATHWVLTLTGFILGVAGFVLSVVAL
jgi:hypothetical protein